MKKVVSLLLVVVLALGMSTMAFAKIGNGPLTTGALTDPPAPSGGWDDVRPGTKVSIALPSNIFADDGNSPAFDNATGGVTKNEISRGKVTVRTKIAKGSNVIKEVKFVYDVPSASTVKFARIQVEFIDPFVNASTDGQDFDVTVFLTVDGTRYEEVGAQLAGTLINSNIGAIDADTDYVNLDGGRIVEVDEYSKNVEYYLGSGVSVFGKAFKDKTYYGYVTMDATEAQEQLMDKYGIDEVYNLKTVGLQGVANHVVLENTDADAYVYDADLKYLGQGKDELAYSAVYYLASKKLDVDDEGDFDDTDEPEDEDDVPEAPPITGGFDDIENENANPSTGA